MSMILSGCRVVKSNKWDECKYIKTIVGIGYQQTSDSHWDAYPVLEDIICFIDLMKPKHHNEYDCTKCNYYLRNHTTKT